MSEFTKRNNCQHQSIIIVNSGNTAKVKCKKCKKIYFVDLNSEFYYEGNLGQFE